MRDDIDDCTRVFVVTGLRFYRDALTSALAQGRDVEVVGSAGGLGEALAMLPTARPTAILVDVSLSGGLAAIRQLAEVEGAKVLALGVADVEGDVLACAEAGASAYVTRDQTLTALHEAVRAVGRDEAPCTARMAATLLRRIATLARERRPPSPAGRLTERELEILGLIDLGLSNKQIARRLFIEVSTVKNHVHNILEKLGVERRGEAAARLRGATPGSGAGHLAGAAGQA
jgi:DNA-binding NarL/FixJ family response regulator